MSAMLRVVFLSLSLALVHSRLFLENCAQIPITGDVESSAFCNANEWCTVNDARHNGDTLFACGPNHRLRNFASMPTYTSMQKVDKPDNQFKTPEQIKREELSELEMQHTRLFNVAGAYHRLPDSVKSYTHAMWQAPTNSLQRVMNSVLEDCAGCVPQIKRRCPEALINDGDQDEMADNAQLLQLILKFPRCEFLLAFKQETFHNVISLVLKPMVTVVLEEQQSTGKKKTATTTIKTTEVVKFHQHNLKKRQYILDDETLTYQFQYQDPESFPKAELAVRYVCYFTDKYCSMSIDGVKGLKHPFISEQRLTVIQQIADIAFDGMLPSGEPEESPVLKSPSRSFSRIQTSSSSGLPELGKSLSRSTSHVNFKFDLDHQQDDEGSTITKFPLSNSPSRSIKLTNTRSLRAPELGADDSIVPKSGSVSTNDVNEDVDGTPNSKLSLQLPERSRSSTPEVMRKREPALTMADDRTISSNPQPKLMRSNSRVLTNIIRNKEALLTRKPAGDNGVDDKKELKGETVEEHKKSKVDDDADGEAVDDKKKRKKEKSKRKGGHRDKGTGEDDDGTL